jgi:hypothetical protein
LIVTEVWCSRTLNFHGTTDYGKLKTVLAVIEPLAKSRKYGGDGPYVSFGVNNDTVEIRWREYREDLV